MGTRWENISRMSSGGRSGRAARASSIMCGLDLEFAMKILVFKVLFST